MTEIGKYEMSQKVVRKGMHRSNIIPFSIVRMFISENSWIILRTDLTTNNKSYDSFLLATLPLLPTSVSFSWLNIVSIFPVFFLQRNYNVADGLAVLTPGTTYPVI